MKQILLLLITVLLFSACEIKNSNNRTLEEINQSEKVYNTQESEAFKKGKRQLEIQGYKNIKEVSYPLFCCAEEDSFLLSTGFTATDNEGYPVKGCLCVKSIFRNSVTIRFE